MLGIPFLGPGDHESLVCVLSIFGQMFFTFKRMRSPFDPVFDRKIFRLSHAFIFVSPAVPGET